jgi:hypothetical protein
MRAVCDCELDLPQPHATADLAHLICRDVLVHMARISTSTYSFEPSLYRFTKHICLFSINTDEAHLSIFDLHQARRE